MRAIRPVSGGCIRFAECVQMSLGDAGMGGRKVMQAVTQPVLPRSLVEWLTDSGCERVRLAHKKEVNTAIQPSEGSDMAPIATLGAGTGGMPIAFEMREHARTGRRFMASAADES